MIRFNTTVKLQSYNAYLARLRNVKVVSNRAMQKAVDENRRPALAELQEQPGKVKYPIEWASEKQRRAYFATDGFGAGIPYQRTGKLARSWELVFVESPDGGTFIFRNENKAARYVGGSLARSLQAAQRFQQPFHKNTGWQLYKLTVDFWTDSIIESYKKYMLQAWGAPVDASFGSRAITPRLGR